VAEVLGDMVRFRGDRLFNGAVSIDWFINEPDKSRLASECFVFHGPEYHGVAQDDVGDVHGHRLIDTASFTRSIIRGCYGLEDEPFTLAIAGYGTGKSHLGLTIANLVSSPYDGTASKILSSLRRADAARATEIGDTLTAAAKPCLVLALNGMRGCNLAAEMATQITGILRRDGHDTAHLDSLRPRFNQAASLIDLSNSTVRDELIAAAEADSLDALLVALGDQDEHIYAVVHDFFEKRGMPIAALSGESVHDVIDIAVREYCGAGKPYQSLLVLFDEFGKYTEFATVRSSIAGNGALQELFEGIQANAAAACFVGFIQFELNAYVQRIAPEYKNEILRYITRYQSAARLYLSINLETLIASLIEKREPDALRARLDSSDARTQSEEAMGRIARWFPHSQNYRTWTDGDLFHSVVCRGCWPLSPYSIWLLFYLAAAGKHLQERSALSLLADVIGRFENHVIGNEASIWPVTPVFLCTDMLLDELVNSEETGPQGSIAHSYASVLARHGTRLSTCQRQVLQAILLASKLGVYAESRPDAIEALSALSGLSTSQVVEEADLLQQDYNVIEWDESFKAFDILGDAVPRSQFLAFIRQRVALSYDETLKAGLFASRGSEWCDLLADVECDFAEENRIYTREWKYQAVTAVTVGGTQLWNDGDGPD
jgi:hypothetical protein